jgi:hypothetical protein
MPNGFVRTEIRNRPQFGHILKSNSFQPPFRSVRKTNTNILQLPQIHSRSPRRVPRTLRNLILRAIASNYGQQASRGGFNANFVGMS